MFKPWKALVALGLLLAAAGDAFAAAPAPSAPVTSVSLSAAVPAPARPTVAPSCRRATYVRYRGRRVRARYVGSRIVRYNGRRYRIRYYRRY